MREVWLMSTGVTTVNEPFLPDPPWPASSSYAWMATWSGAPSNVAPTEILPSALPVWPRHQLSGGPATVDDGLVRALVKSGGEVHGGRVEVTIDGVDYTGALIAQPTIGQHEDDKYPTTVLQFASQRLSFLRHLVAEPGKTVVLTWIQRDASGGEVYRLPVFQGRTQSPEEDSAAKITTIRAEGLAGIIDRAPFYRSLRLDGSPAGSVIRGEGGELAATAANNDQYIDFASGTVAFDTSYIGRPPNRNGSGFQGGPRGSNFGGHGYFGGPGHGLGGAGGTSGGGYIQYVSFPAFRLDLTTQDNLTLDDEDAMGLKSIFAEFIPPGAAIVASDDGPPPGAVPLFQWEHKFLGMPINQQSLVDIRPIFFRENERRISNIIEYALTEANIDTSAIEFPTKNDDVLTGHMEFTSSTSEALDQLCALARWKWSYDGPGNLRFWVDEINRAAGGLWTYTRNQYRRVRFTSPQLQDIPGGGLVVEGMHTENLGRTEWKETLIRNIYGPEPKRTGSGAGAGVDLGGSLLPYGDRSDRRELKSRVEETHYYVGDSEVLWIEEHFEKRNPPNVGGLNLANRHNLIEGAGGTESSAESGVDFLYDEEQMELVRRIRWEAYYYGGIFRGFTKTTETNEPRTTSAPGGLGWGAPFGGPPWYGPLEYGWADDGSKMKLIQVDIVEITPTGFGFIAQQLDETYADGNPNVNYETGKGPGRSIGAYRRETNDLILLLEETTTFTRDDFEWYQIDRDKREFRKKSMASAHQGIGFGGGYPSGMGHQEGEIIGGEIEHQRRRGQPPSVQGIRDEIKVRRVGATLFSPTVAADYGDQSYDVIQPPHLQSFEQAQRFVQWRWSNRMSYGADILAPYNPRLWLTDDVRLQHNVEDGRLLDVLGRMFDYNARLPYQDGQPSEMEFRLKIDYYDMKPFMDARV